MASFLYKLIIFLVESLSRLVCVNRRRVVFCSCGGKSFGGDPSCVADWFIAHDNVFDLVWATTDVNAIIPVGIRKCVIYDSSKSLLGQLTALFRTYYMFSSARVIVCDSKGLRFRKNAHSLYVQTWHGDLPFKLIENECCGELDKGYLCQSKRDSSQINIITSASSEVSHIFKKEFWLPPDCIITQFGIPRNDEYVRGNPERACRMRKAIGISNDIRLAVYAPTFRDDGDTSVYGKLDFIKVKRALETHFDGKWKVLVRLHPNVAASVDGISFNDDVINVSSVADGVGVFLASDLVITDVSSVVRDFMSMNKPIFSFFPDFEHYTFVCRSLRPLFFRLPFRRCATTEELVSEIECFDRAKYDADLASFLKSEGIEFYDTGHATEKICEIIVEFVKSGKIVVPEDAYRLVGA